MNFCLALNSFSFSFVSDRSICIYGSALQCVGGGTGGWLQGVAVRSFNGGVVALKVCSRRHVSAVVRVSFYGWPGGGGRRGDAIVVSFGGGCCGVAVVGRVFVWVDRHRLRLPVERTTYLSVTHQPVGTTNLSVPWTPPTLTTNPLESTTHNLFPPRRVACVCVANVGTYRAEVGPREVREPLVLERRGGRHALVGVHVQHAPDEVCVCVFLGGVRVVRGDDSTCTG